MEKSLPELSPLTVLSPDIWGHLTLFLDWKAIKELLISTEMLRLRLIRGLHKLSIAGKIPPVLRFMSGLLEFETTLNVTNELACMLPTSLRTLRCPQFETDLDLSKLPRSMDSLDFYLSVSGAINTKGFPSTLTSFTSTNWGGWTAHELSKLPKTLVVLRISSRLTWRPLVDEALEHLPRGLEVLELTLGEILCDVCIPLLPRTLKSLKLQPKLLFLTSIGISRLPPLLTQLYLPSALDGPIKTLKALNGFTGADIELTPRTPWPFPLPSIPSLTELSIPRLRSPIMDSLRQLSPSLTFLDLRSVLDLSFDGHLHSLQQLRTLKLRIISRHDIPYLPSTLTTLVGSNCLQAPNPIHSDYVRNLLAEVNNLANLIDNVKKNPLGKARTTIHGSTGMTDFMVENKDLLPEHMHAELLPRALKRLHILSLFTLRSLHYLPPHLSEFISGNGEFTFLVTDLIKTLKSAPAPLFKPIHHLDFSRLRTLAEAASSSSPDLYTSSQLDDSTETVAAPRTPERVYDPWDMPIESAIGLEFLHQPGNQTCILLHPFPELGEFEDWAVDRIKTLCISSWNVGMIIPKRVENLVIVSPPTQPGATTEPTSSIPPGCNFGNTSVTTLIVSNTVAAHGLGATPTALPQSLVTLELSISGPWLNPLPPHLTSLRLKCSWSTLDLISILLSIPPSLKALKVTYGAVKNKSSYPQSTIGVALKMVDQYMQLWNLYSYDDSYPNKVPGQPYLANITEEETEVDFASLTGDQVPNTSKKTFESEDEDEEDNYDEDEDEGLEVEDYNDEGERLVAVRSPPVRSERAEKDAKRESKMHRKTILAKLKKLKSQIFEGHTDLALTDEFWTFCTLRLLRDCRDLEDIHFDLQEWNACLAAQVAFLCADPSPSVDETVTGIPKRLARLFRTDWTAEQQASPEAIANVYNSTHTALLPRIMAAKPPSDEEQASAYPTWEPTNAASSSSDVGVKEEKKSNPIHHIPQELVVDDESIKDLAPSMTVLEIPNNTTLSASSLRYLPSSLTVFSLISNQNIDDAAVSILPSGLTNLVLGSTKLTDLCVPSLPRGLTELGVRCNFSDAAIAHLPRSLKILSMGNNTAMSDVGISLLPPGLEKLNLMANLRLTERSIGALPRSLVHLNLYSNTNMTDDSMSALPEGLVYLNLSGDVRLTDLGVSKLPRGLTELILVHNNRITDKGMAFMPRTLTHLRMRANQHITGAGLAELPPGMRSLHLDMAQLTNDDLSRAPHWLLEFSIPAVIGHQSVFSELPLLALNTSEAWMRYKRN